MQQRFKTMKHAAAHNAWCGAAGVPGFERASPMPNANTKVKTRAARPTLSVLKESLKRQTFLVLSDEARAAAGQGALLPKRISAAGLRTRAPLRARRPGAHERRLAQRLEAA